MGLEGGGLGSHSQGVVGAGAGREVEEGGQPVESPDSLVTLVTPRRCGNPAAPAATCREEC